MSRVHATLAALALVLSSLFGMIHEATTTHVLCAQHGELIHGETGLLNPANPAVAAKAVAQGRGPTVRDLQAVASHGHEHCALISAMRASRMAPRPPVVVSAPVAVGRLAIAVAPVVHGRDSDLYLTAPKTSPPA